ncbi:MAG: putative Ig domain-containing protein [Phycisphaerae bacterium]
MRTRMPFFATLATLGLSAMRIIAADGTPASRPPSMPSKGLFRSDRTLEDMKVSEAALKEQQQKDWKAAPLKTKSGTYTDVNGYVFKYGLSLPAKMEQGKKYPVFIGNTGWTLTTAQSQAEYPCHILNVYMPETLFKPKPQGFDAPKDYKTVYAAAIKAVIDKLLAEEPTMDGSKIYIEGASKFGALSLIAAYNYPDTFAAAVPSVGGCDVYKAVAIGQRKIGVWFFYGVLDGGEPDFKKIGRGGPGLYKAMADAGHDANITVYTHGDHHEYGFSDSTKNPEWNDFTRLRQWLFARKKPAMAWPVINSPSAAAATVGKAFTYTINADKPAKSFGAAITIEHAEDKDGKIAKPEHDLPQGLTLDAKTGVISGTPREAGRFFIRLSAAGDKGEGITTLELVVKDK